LTLVFDEVLLEGLATSFLDIEQWEMGPLRNYVVTTFVRRYLSRSHWHHAKHERAAVNAVQFLEVGHLTPAAAVSTAKMLCSTNAKPVCSQAMLEATVGMGNVSANALLLPLLQPLIGALWPSERGAKPSLAVREAVHRWAVCKSGA
jgi:hypothetical protein